MPQFDIAHEDKPGSVRISLWQCGACLTKTPNREDTCRNCRRPRQIAQERTPLYKTGEETK